MANPKATAEQAADTTGCVVININGENIIYEGDNPDTNTVTVYDTVAVDTSGSSGLFTEFTLIREILYTADYEDGGWTFESGVYTSENVLAVYFRRGSVDSQGVSGDTWMEFNEYMELFVPALYTTLPTK